MPAVGAAGTKPSTPGVVAGRAPGAAATASGAAKPAMANPAAVRTVVDTDGAGTALAIAALLASLVSFGVVLMSFLQK